MDSKRYTEYTEEKEKEFESVCKRCGSCCGANDDPCQNLVKLGDGTFLCKAYDTRLGPQKTVSGNEFRCIPISYLIAGNALRPNCEYRRYLKNAD